MRSDAILRQAHQRARRHALIGTALAALPWVAVASALVWRTGAALAWLALVAVLLVSTLHVWRRMRAMDARWLARSLDARRPDMEDSAALLLGLQPATAALPALQRVRLQTRIEQAPAPELRIPWNARALATSALLAAIALSAVLLWPRSEPGTAATGPQRADAAAASGAPPRLIARQLEIHPPGYTGLPVRRIDALSARVPVGTELRWSLRFAPEPAQAALVFLDGQRLSLQRDNDGAWRARRRIERGMLYTVEPAQPGRDGQPQMQRIDAIADRAPRVRVLQPASTLSTVQTGQRNWTVAFEAEDDYGLAATARLRVIRTEGSGENITSNEQALTLRGTGTGKRRRYAHTFALGALGLVPGDDLIVQLVVSDRQEPRPHAVASPSLILRWPPEVQEQAAGLDGMMKKVMPAYFRSQRQIIIDAEALLKEKPRITADEYLQRSDTIGVDQRLLRLRYGQFLGEESEGAPQLPTSDAPADGSADESDLPTNDPAAPTTHDASEPAAEGEDTHAPGDGHDHDDGEPAQRQAAFGEQQQVLERFGHTHDIPEAATLLDPKTRELLRAALDEMWQSEVNLRQAKPEAALPYAYRALDFIKRVQQSERIYLAKVGVDLPPIDPGRRLSGERAGLADRTDPMRMATTPDPTIADAWRALAPAADGAEARVDLDALARWLASHDVQGGDPLAIAAAIQSLRRDPACPACRERLRALLWPLLARPPAAPAPRERAGRIGDAYLDALGREARP
jgi:hypothetical protein